MHPWLERIKAVITSNKRLTIVRKQEELDRLLLKLQAKGNRLNRELQRLEDQVRPHKEANHP